MRICIVQQFALDKLMDLVDKTEPPQTSLVDSFVVERRIESRYPRFAQELASFAQGYNATSESALAQLKFLELHFEVNPAMKHEIITLCEQ